MRALSLFELFTEDSSRSVVYCVYDIYNSNDTVSVLLNVAFILLTETETTGNTNMIENIG